jgi:hypothetical protein
LLTSYSWRIFPRTDTRSANPLNSNQARVSVVTVLLEAAAQINEWACMGGMTTQAQTGA